MAHCTYGCDGCVHHSTPQPGYSGFCVEASYSQGLSETVLCFVTFFGRQSLSDTLLDDLLLEWELVLKSQKDVYHCKSCFILTGFQEVWPIQTCLIKMSLFNHHLTVDINILF